MNKSKKILLILDFFQKGSILKYYNEFLGTTRLNKEEIKNIQYNKLIKLLNYTVKNVPFYREVIPRIVNYNESNAIDNLNEFPILDRELFYKNSEKFISDAYDKNVLKKASSSGTTGIPISYYYNQGSLSAGVAAGYLAYSLSGWRLGDKTLHVWGNPTSVKHWSKKTSRIKRKIKNQVNLPSTIFNDRNNYEKTYKFIKKQKFKSIDGYTTAIYQLAKFIEDKNYPKLNIQYVFTTAENLQDYQKSCIEKNIGPVSDLYGCGEINGIAIKPVNQNEYLIIDPHVYVETINEGNGLKSILVTDLDNYAMPLIRYKVGDLIDDVYEPDDNNFPQFRRFKKVFGRSSDMIELPNGKKILPVNIVGGTLFRKIGNITKHKVTWDGTKLTFIFETENGFSLPKAKNTIFKEFEEYKILTEISVVEKIEPDKNGKYKYFERIN